MPVGGSAHGSYGDEVEELDWSFGQILQALDHFNFTDNTLIYFSSDNGGHLEEVDGAGHLAGGYNGIYRGGSYVQVSSVECEWAFQCSGGLAT